MAPWAPDSVEHPGPFAVLVVVEWGRLYGWVPLMDYKDPVDQADAWPGQWQGPITPPKLP